MTIHTLTKVILWQYHKHGSEESWIWSSRSTQYGALARSRFKSQISFALLTGLVARANHLFYRFWTVFRVPYAIRPWYESCVRLVSPYDLAWSRTCDRSASALVVFGLYFKSFRHRSVIIRLLSSKMHIRHSYENIIRYIQSFQSN